MQIRHGVVQAVEAGPLVTAEVPLVSVIVPLFNAAATIRAALDSIRATQWRSLEVFVVDDGSVDDGMDIVKEYGLAWPALKLILLRHPDMGNHGPAASRNAGIIASTGEFVCFLDADDLYMPNRFVESVEALLREPELDAVYGAYQYGLPDGVNSCRDVTSDHVFSSQLGEVYDNEPQLYSLLSGKSGLHTSTVTMRRRCAIELGGFPHLRYVDDLAFWIRLFATKHVRRVGVDPISIYVIHSDSWCSRGQRSDDFLFGPAIARLNAMEWFDGIHVEPVLQRRVEKEMRAKLLSRYHEAARRGRASQKFMLSLMWKAIKLAPMSLLDSNFLTVFGRLLLNMHPTSLVGPVATDDR